MKKKIPSIASNLIYKNLKKLTYCLLFLAPILSFAQADDSISPFLQFNGNYDFTAIGNTLNLDENGNGVPCVIQTASSAELTLETNQTIVSAHLYWAGSGTLTAEFGGTSDDIVFLNDIEVRPSPEFDGEAFGASSNSYDFFYTSLVILSIRNYTITDIPMEIRGRVEGSSKMLFKHALSTKK